MKRPCSFVLAVVLGLAFINVFPAQSQAPKPKPTPYPTASAAQIEMAQQMQRQREWFSAGWTQSNAPYAKIRKQLDAKLKAKIPASKQATQYALTEANKYDPSAQFKWAYVAYLAEMTHQPNQDKLIHMGEVMDRNLQPGDYDWARLRFLIETSKVWQSPDEILPVGQRLLKRNPNDIDIKYAVIRMMGMSKTLPVPQRRQGLVMAKQELAKRPRSVKWTNVAGLLAEAIWNVQSKEQNNAQNNRYIKEAKGYYVRMLNLLPPNSPARRNVVEMIVSSELIALHGTDVTGPMWKAALVSTKWK